MLGADVPTYNIPGVTAELNFTGEALAGIFLGKITKWNDAELVKANPNVKLPANDIVVVHRSDGSGTSFIWTDYLSKVSSEWKSKVGEGTAVQWPVGLGGKGNEGVSAFVQRLPGSIGYVEYAYAKQNKLAHALMANKDGQFVAPSDDAFKAAAAGADWAKTPGMGVILTDQAGKASDYLPLVVSYKNGAAVRLSDVAEVKDSVLDVRNAGLLGKQPLRAAHPFELYLQPSEEKWAADYATTQSLANRPGWPRLDTIKQDSRRELHRRNHRTL